MNFARAVKFSIVAVVLGILLSACTSSSSSENSDAAKVMPKPCPTFVVSEGEEIPQAQADLLIGMVEAEAEACAQQLGWQWRVGERDGEFFALTMDYRPDRVTVQLKNGLIYLVNVG